MNAYLCLILALAGVANAAVDENVPNLLRFLAYYRSLYYKMGWFQVNSYARLVKELHDAFPVNEPYVLKQEIEDYVTSTRDTTPFTTFTNSLATFYRDTQVQNVGGFDAVQTVAGDVLATVAHRTDPVEFLLTHLFSFRSAFLGYDTKAEIMRIFIKTDMERYDEIFSSMKDVLNVLADYHDDINEAGSICDAIDRHMKLTAEAIRLTSNEFVTHLDLAKATGIAEEVRVIYHRVVATIVGWRESVVGRFDGIRYPHYGDDQFVWVDEYLKAAPRSLMEYLRNPLRYIDEAFRWKYNDVNTRSILDNTFRVMRTIINDNILTAILNEAKDESKRDITTALTEFMTAVDNHETSIRTVLTAHGLNDAVFNTQNGSFETFVQAVTTFVNSYKAAIKKGADDLPKENRATKVHGAMLVDAKIRRLTVNAVTIIVNLRWNDYQKPGTDAARLTEWKEVNNAVKKIMMEFDALEYVLTTYSPGNSTTDVLKPYEKMGDKVMEAIDELKKLEQSLRSVHPNGAFQMPAMDAPNPTHELLKQFEQLLIERYFYEGNEHPLKVKTDIMPPESHNLTSAYSHTLSGLLFSTASILLMA